MQTCWRAPSESTSSSLLAFQVKHFAFHDIFGQSGVEEQRPSDQGCLLVQEFKSFLMSEVSREGPGLHNYDVWWFNGMLHFYWCYVV